MIKECGSDYLQQCVEIAFMRNNQPENNSAYCPLSKESILEDFVFIMDNPGSLMLGYFDDNILSAIFGCFFNTDNGWVDCIGPFFHDKWDLGNAKKLFVFAKSKLIKALRFNFYFNTENENLHLLMKELFAKRNDNEYILLLKKEDYVPQQLTHKIVAFDNCYANDVIRLKNDTWQDSYITDHALIDSVGKDRDIFCAIDENSELIGYGVLKHYDNNKRMTAEVFAVKENARGMGYGWALLNTVVDRAFHIHHADTVDLVVDKLNTGARELYASCGFRLMVENSSYCIE